MVPQAHSPRAELAWTVHLGERPPPLRIGLEIALCRADATRVRWFGRGPHESYPDRYAGARVGQWEGSVGEQTFRYCRPQENGNKLDTRWMASPPMTARGTLVVSGAPLSMSCHHFSPADDFGTRPGTKTPVVRHGGALVERDLTTVCVDGGTPEWAASIRCRCRSTAPTRSAAAASGASSSARSAAATHDRRDGGGGEGPPEL